MASDALDRIRSSDGSSSIYDALLRLLDGLGTYEVHPQKASVHVARGRAFLGVHPRKAGLLLNIVLDRPLTTGRVRRSERVSANRWHNDVEVGSVGELDSELVDWLREAYALTQPRPADRSGAG